MMNVHDSDIEIGLLPVPLVLFPGGKLKMTVASAQDQDLLGRSLKDAVGVGLVLSEQQIWVNDGSTGDAESQKKHVPKVILKLRQSGPIARFWILTKTPKASLRWC